MGFVFVFLGLLVFCGVLCDGLFFSHLCVLLCDIACWSVDLCS